MTTLANTAQHEAVKTSYGLYAAGNRGSSAAQKVMSARYIDTSTNNTHPLRFGYGAGRSTDAEGCVSQDITRSAVYTLSATLASNATTIPYDVNDGSSTDRISNNRIVAGDYIAIGDEVIFVRSVDYSADTMSVVRGAKSTTAANHASGDAVSKLGGPSNFAGVIYRDRTRPGRVDDATFVDAFREGEIAPVLFDGDIVCAFSEAVAATDLGKPVSVFGSGTNQGLFAVGDETASAILVPNSRIISTSEDQGSGNTPRYLAIVRFTG